MAVRQSARRSANPGPKTASEPRQPESQQVKPLAITPGVKILHRLPFHLPLPFAMTPISPAMQISIDSFGTVISDPASGPTLSAVQRMDELPDEIVLADQVGLDGFLFRVTHPCCQKRDKSTMKFPPVQVKDRRLLAQQAHGTADPGAEVPAFDRRILHVITAIPLDCVLKIRGYGHMVIDRAELHVARRSEMPC
jgi:hypothetical protein